MAEGRKGRELALTIIKWGLLDGGSGGPPIGQDQPPTYAPAGDWSCLLTGTVPPNTTRPSSRPR